MTLQKFLALLKYDTFVTILPMAAKMLSADAANTDPLNLLTQWTKFQVDVIAAAPTLEADAFTALAQLVNSEAQTLIQSAAKAAGVAKS
jgi:hypothetical protein